MTECKTIWSAAQKRLSKTLDRDSYQRFLAGVSPVAIDREHGVFSLAAPNELIALWLEANYRELVTDAIRDESGESFEVKFSGDGVPTPAASETPRRQSEPSKSKPAKDAGYTSPYRPDFTFDSFVVGNNNRIVHAAARAVSEAPGKAYNPLFIYGGVGLGKTHLLQAIASEVHRRRPRAKINFLTSEEFVNLYVEALQLKKLAQFRRQVRSLDLLLIDDVHFFEGKVGSSEEFFHTFNALHNAHKQIVLASDRTPQQMNGLEQRLVSRFEWGLSEQILPPEFETRVAILKKKQEAHSIKLSDDILYLIANRIPSNIRNLESALTKLIMNISAFGCDMTVDRAEELLRDKFESEAVKMVTIDAIQRRVAEHFDIRVADMMSRKRPQNIAGPRMIAMYLSRKLTNNSLPAIGDAFNRNHATIMHAVETVENRMHDDDGFRMTIGALKRRLRSP